MGRTSAISRFYKLPIEKRIRIVKKFANLTDEEASLLREARPLSLELADRMIENVIGTFPIPLGVAVNFLINKQDYLIPMATEEPSVVAAASNAAKIAREGGGFYTSSTSPIMIGQIQVTDVEDPYRARMHLLSHKEKILKKANEQDPVLLSAGGGAKDLSAKVIPTASGPMLIAELHVDCRDAMGANAVNTMAEAAAPIIERIVAGKVYLRILSNLATERLARAYVTIPKDAIGGEGVVEGIIRAYHFAASDPYRAATHNKGILNGVVAVVLATCNDHRAIEAGAHAYASRTGHYTSLSSWEENKNGDLVGSLEIPMAVGIVGGATRTHPISRIVLKILGVGSSTELGEVMTAVGLAQNLAALRALASEGIQHGHMRLHARNIAIAAGATNDLIDVISEQMVKERKIRADRAEEIIRQYRRKNR